MQLFFSKIFTFSSDSQNLRFLSLNASWIPQCFIRTSSQTSHLVMEDQSIWEPLMKVQFDHMTQSCPINIDPSEFSPDWLFLTEVCYHPAELQEDKHAVWPAEGAGPQFENHAADLSFWSHRFDPLRVSKALREGTVSLTLSVKGQGFNSTVEVLLSKALKINMYLQFLGVQEGFRWLSADWIIRHLHLHRLHVWQVPPHLQMEQFVKVETSRLSEGLWVEREEEEDACREETRLLCDTSLSHFLSQCFYMRNDHHSP